MEDLLLDIGNGGVDYITTRQIEPWIAGMEEAKAAVVNGAVQLEPRELGPRTLVEDLVGG